MYYFYLVAIICLFIAPAYSSEAPVRLFMTDAEQYEASAERPRKIAWAEKESDKKECVRYDHIFDSHMQRRLYKELEQATTLPTVVNQLIIGYAPHKWANHVLPIYPGFTVFNILYATDTIAHSRRTHNDAVCAWEIEHGSIVPVDPTIKPLAKPKAWQLTDGGAFSDYAISPNNHTIAACSPQALYVWKAMQSFKRAKLSGKMLHIPIHELQAGPPNFIHTITFSPCSNYLFAGSRIGKVYAFNLQTKKLVCMLMHDAGVTALACNADGSELLAGLANGNVYVWRGTPFDRSFVGSQENISAAGPAQQQFSDEDLPPTLLPIPRPPCGKITYTLCAMSDGYYIECTYHASRREKCQTLASSACCVATCCGAVAIGCCCCKRFCCIVCIRNGHLARIEEDISSSAC